MILEYENKEIVLPDFLIIGAAKAGTSSLNYWLDNYDEIYMPTPKEPNFFAFKNFNEDFCKNLELKKATNLYNFDFDDYQKLFKENKNKKIGDASTAYIQYPDSVISNIKKYYGNNYNKLKLIVLLRNPIDKVFSHYLMFVKWGIETRTFKEAVLPKYKKANTIIEEQINYLDSGYYYEDLKKYIDSFDCNLKIYLFEDILNDKNKFIKDVLTHLEIIDKSLPSNINDIFNEGGVPKNDFSKKIFEIRNNNSYFKNLIRTLLPSSIKDFLRDNIDCLIKSKFSTKPKIDNESKTYLQKLFKDDILKTSSLIERDLTDWIK